MTSDRVEGFSRTIHGVPLLNMNRRGHWAKDDDARKDWKNWGRMMGAVVRSRRGVMTTPVRIIVCLYWNDRRVRDAGNYGQTGKAIVDGLVQSRLVPDDRDTMVVGPDMRRIPKSGDPINRLSVIIQETTIAGELATITNIADRIIGQRHSKGEQK